MDVAAKTGTTNENFDRWLCGFTNYYTAVTWYGFDLNETIEFNTNNPAGFIWSSVMNNIHSNLQPSTFEKANGILEVEICSSTNQPATLECENTYLEYFLKNTIPDLCSKHPGIAKEVTEIKTSSSDNISKFIEEKTTEIIKSFN